MKLRTKAICCFSILILLGFSHAVFAKAKGGIAIQLEAMGVVKPDPKRAALEIQTKPFVDKREDKTILRQNNKEIAGPGLLEQTLGKAILDQLNPEEMGSANPLGEMFKNSMHLELQSAGYRTTNEPQKYCVTGEILQFEVEKIQTPLKMTFKAHYKIKLQLLEAGAESALWEQELYRSYDPDKIGFATIKTVVIRFVNESFPKFVKDIFTSTAVVAELDKLLESEKASPPKNASEKDEVTEPKEKEGGDGISNHQ